MDDKTNRRSRATLRDALDIATLTGLRFLLEAELRSGEVPPEAAATLRELSAAVGGALEDCQSQLDLDMGTAVRATVFFTELLRAGDGRVDTGVTLVPPEQEAADNHTVAANAHLLAAAPEMYAYLARQLRTLNPEAASAQMIRRILAKARGEDAK